MKNPTKPLIRRGLSCFHSTITIRREKRQETAVSIYRGTFHYVWRETAQRAVAASPTSLLKPEEPAASSSVSEEMSERANCLTSNLVFLRARSLIHSLKGWYTNTGVFTWLIRPGLGGAVTLEFRDFKHQLCECDAQTD